MRGRFCVLRENLLPFQSVDEKAAPVLSNVPESGLPVSGQHVVTKKTRALSDEVDTGSS
jgi:hypothetical protein